MLRGEVAIWGHILEGVEEGHEANVFIWAGFLWFISLGPHGTRKPRKRVKQLFGHKGFEMGPQKNEFRLLATLKQCEWRGSRPVLEI